MRLHRPLLAILLLLSTAANAGGQGYDYSLYDLDGKLYRVSDYRGEWLVINFWATWCSPCLEEMPELEKFYRSNRSRAMVWGVTFEDSDKEKIIQFVERLGVTYPILGYGQDPLTGFGQVVVLPTTFVIDPDGLLGGRFEGPITARDIVELIER